MKHVVIAGGGFAGVRLARKLRGEKNIKITLINESEDFRYSPALYRAAAGFKVGTARIPLEWMLLDSDNINVVYDKVTKVNTEKKQFTLAEGDTIPYDYGVCALGTVTTYFNISGIADHSFGIKSVDEILTLKKHIHTNIANETKKKHNYVVIGAGPTGVEVAATLGEYVQTLMKRHKVKNPQAEVFLVEGAPRILPAMRERASRKAQNELERLGVTVLTDTKVSSSTNLSLKTSNGNIATQNVIWTAGAMNNPFYKENEKHFKFNDRGKVKVNRHLQAHGSLYVAGDNADTPFSGLAFTAINHANYLARDIKARVHGKRRKKQKDYFPPQLVPVGSIAVFQYRSIVLGGRLMSVVRRFADFIGYNDVLGPLKALTIWQNSERVEDDWCDICRRKRT